jgi:ketosteroid isomerase-like protein
MKLGDDIKLGNEMEKPTIEIARQAFDCFSQGWATGNFQPFINLLSDDVQFWLPVGKQQDKSVGYENKQQLIVRLQARTEAGDRLMFSLPDHVTHNDITVAFEFESQGTIRNHPFKGRNAISFDIAGDKITGIREYLGDID